MKWFFKLKHWQVFIFTGLLLFAPTVAPMFVSGDDVDPFFVMRWAMPLWLISYIGYHFLCGFGLSKLAGKTSGRSYYTFMTLISIALVYSFFIGFIVLNSSSGKTEIGDIFVFILPVHLLSMVGIIVAIKYNAKLLNVIEQGSKTSYPGFLSDFFLFWLLPLGVWSIQPRLTKIYLDKNKLSS